MSVLLEIENVSKSFSSKKVLSDITISVNSGEVYALMGQNGAGKTTLIKIITGLLAATSGKVLLDGYDIQSNPVDAKRIFGYVSDDPSAYEYLSGYEFLHLTAGLLGMSESEGRRRINELADLFPIEKILNEKMSNYSRGNKQKVAFLAALLGKPRLLIIDEPIVGLDPESISIFGKTLVSFAKGGGAVLLSTHILDFAKENATNFGIIHDGKLVHEGKRGELSKIGTLYQKYTK